MGRLSGLKPTVGRLAPRVGYAEGDTQAAEQQRYQLSPWRNWYHLARWKELRQRVFLRDGYTCQMCGCLEGNTALLVADHKIPHRGQEYLFWDEGNVQCLCKACHDKDKQAIERDGRSM